MGSYDIEHYITKFEAIPDELWCTNTFAAGDKRCVMGHCGRTAAGRTPESNRLYDMFLGTPNNIVEVNDGTDNDYKQPTPKQRVLAALRDLKDGKLHG